MFLGSSLSGGSWSAAAYTHTYFVPRVELFWFLMLRFGFLNWRTGSFIVGEIIRPDMGFGGRFFHPLSSMYNDILKYDTKILFMKIGLRCKFIVQRYSLHRHS